MPSEKSTSSLATDHSQKGAMLQPFAQPASLKVQLNDDKLTEEERTRLLEQLATLEHKDQQKQKSTAARATANSTMQAQAKPDTTLTEDSDTDEEDNESLKFHDANPLPEAENLETHKAIKETSSQSATTLLNGYVKQQVAKRDALLHPTTQPDAKNESKDPHVEHSAIQIETHKANSQPEEKAVEAKKEEERLIQEKFRAKMESKHDDGEQSPRTPDALQESKKVSPIYASNYLEAVNPAKILQATTHEDSKRQINNLYSALELNLNLALAAAQQADQSAFEQLTKAKKAIERLKENIDILLNRQRASLEKLNLTENKRQFLEKAVPWLEKMKLKFQELHEETMAIQHHEKKKFRSFFTEVKETKDLNEFHTWLSQPRSGLNSATAAPLLRGRTLDSTQVNTQEIKITDNVYRLYSLTPNSNESALYEREYKVEGHPQYEVGLVDLPKQISDRYLLAQFIQNKTGRAVKDGKDEGKAELLTPESAKELVMFSKLPATLTKSDVALFFQQHMECSIINTPQRCAASFLEYMDKNRTEPVPTRMLQRNGVLQGNIRNVKIPNMIVFNEAKRMLDTIIAHGQFPVYFDHASNKQLMRAIDILVQLNSNSKLYNSDALAGKIFITAYIPKDYRYDLSQAPEEVITKLKTEEYQLLTLSQGEKAINAAKVAANSIAGKQPEPIEQEAEDKSNMSSPRPGGH